MNYSTFIVKFITSPEQSFFEDDTSVTEVLVQFAENTNETYVDTFQISVWGSLAYDVKKYYKINDYLIIEGYLSFSENYSESLINDIDNEIEFTVNKIYPFVLKSDSIDYLDGAEKKTYGLPF